MNPLRRLDHTVAKASPRERHLSGVVASAAALAVVTGLVYALKPVVPILSLGVLYLFAILPVAVIWGRVYAIGLSIASMLAFNFFFLPPLYTLTIADESNWAALVVYLATGVLVSDLAARARRRADEAEQREQEEALLAEIATSLLQGGDISAELDRSAESLAGVLRVKTARIEVGLLGEPPVGESPLELRAGDERIGTLFVREGAEPNLEIRRRFLPALASLIAIATERDRLGRQAVAAEALRQSDSIKTAVLRAVSHDLRSPLTAIRVAADSLGSGSLELGSGEREELLETIRVEVRRLDRIVGNLLDLSRLQAGAAEMRKQLHPVDELIAQALAQLGPDDELIDVSLPVDIPLVEADPVQIEQVLVNMLENALRFSPPGGRVHVRATSTRKEVIVRVVDQGPGIAEDELELIFEPFQQGAGAEEGRGSGLGLAVARGFAESNGGRIWAESRPGQGASFALALPLAEEPVRMEV